MFPSSLEAWVHRTLSLPASDGGDDAGEAGAGSEAVDAGEAGFGRRTHEAGLAINGPFEPGQCLPNTLSLAVLGVRAQCCLHALHTTVAASAGAACHSPGGPGAETEA